MTTLRLARLFLTRRTSGSRLASALPIAAFAVVTTALMIVVAGARALYHISMTGAEETGLLLAATVVALALLLVPLFSLGAAAAKLAARRRDARLSSLRLLGATSKQVTSLTVIEAALNAMFGALIGTVGYAALAPLVGLIHFGGQPLGALMWLRIWWIPTIWLLVAKISAASAALGLKGVLVTPLGIRTRQIPRIAKGRRAIIAAALVALGMALLTSLQTLGELTGALGMLIGVFVAFGCGLLALDAIGPWFIGWRARVAVRKAEDVEQLLAARMTLDDPFAAWRQVSGLAVTTFVGVIAAAGLGIVSIASGGGATAAEMLTLLDMRTGVYVTLAIAFLMVACTVGINQAANMLDRARVQVSLDRLGVPQQLLARAARRSVMSSVTGVVVGAAVLAVALVLPLIGMSVLLNPTAMLTMVAVFLVGALVVRAGASIAGALVPSILANPDRVL